MTNNEENLSKENKIYTVLSIGQRGAGKTVFLASSYQTFKNQATSGNQANIVLRFQEEESEEDIEKILNYVARTGQYPPATLKISNFDFNLEKNSGDRSEKMATIRWWDVPGESCQIYNLAFVNMALQADACLLFLEAPSLLNDAEKPNNYLKIFQTLIEIINYNKIQFNLGIIISKCDLVISDKKCWQNLQIKVQELEQKLREQKVDHRFFYSTVLIDSQQGTLQANQALDSLSWLLSQIDQQLVNIS
ncbi:TRAFAC clade GTPase domain-containing protein [Microcystis aeruginosa]|jgi:hypothetical protein|uniref:Double-GTPase 2 domain-containing protein n=1 Tax=Microcystis aeruginosa FD4 TaxID=2686288 RepID=A0A857D3F2_MICAE|nr:hypothetical protein [Microcystis aeruginosa]MDB9421701.1 hypothetical protein [Microcystis aeruginosa CS-563/04]NCR10425.1 hypothetical protein [Microcystis aeruginosa LG13-11]QGZ90161.1 hypothetical protein GQR42_11880 [Microcystis aeruginosa FD4]